jgi:hypothetical protein
MAGRSVFAGRTGEAHGFIANHSAAHQADDTSRAPRVMPSNRVGFRRARMAHGRQLPKLPPENGHSANNSEVHVQGPVRHPKRTCAAERRNGRIAAKKAHERLLMNCTTQTIWIQGYLPSFVVLIG